MTFPESKRDRAYWRMLTVATTDAPKVQTIINHILTQRKNVLGAVITKTDKSTTFRVKLKSQELMLIQLSIGNVQCKKPSKRKSFSFSFQTK